MKKIFFIGTNGDLSHESYDSSEELLKGLGQNSGNLVFQKAVTTLFSDPGKCLHFGPSKPYASWSRLIPLSKELQPSAIVFPMANHIRSGNDLQGLTRLLKRVSCPIIIFGLGVQAKQQNVDCDEIQEILNDKSFRDFAHLIESRSGFTFLRGFFTQEVVSSLGLISATVAGCPSLLLNKNPNLGELIQEKIDQYSHDDAKKLVITAANFHKLYKQKSTHSYLVDLEASLLQMSRLKDFLYIQQSGGPQAVESFSNQNWDVENNWYTRVGQKLIASSRHGGNLPWNKIEQSSRFYTKFSEWADEIREYDVCLGTRMHGNMIGISEGLLSIVITHDSRTEELAALMGIPRISSENALRCADIKDIVSQCQFNPTYFNENRRKVSRLYIDAFNRLGLDPSQGLLSLAE